MTALADALRLWSQAQDAKARAALQVAATRHRRDAKGKVSFLSQTVLGFVDDLTAVPENAVRLAPMAHLAEHLATLLDNDPGSLCLPRTSRLRERRDVDG